MAERSRIGCGAALPGNETAWGMFPSDGGRRSDSATGRKARLNRAEASWTGGLGAPPGVGDVIGRYRVLELIGTGGMASVFRASHDGDQVALKILNPARVLPEDVRRFTREFRSLSRMDHENIVRVHEAGV